MLQRLLVRCLQVDLGHEASHRVAIGVLHGARRLRLQCLRVAARAEAPLIARFDARKHVLWDRHMKRVADRRGEGEEGFRRLDAHGMTPLVGRSRATEAVSVEAGADAAASHVGAAALERRSDDIVCRLFQIDRWWVFAHHSQRRRRPHCKGCRQQELVGV